MTPTTTMTVTRMRNRWRLRTAISVSKVGGQPVVGIGDGEGHGLPRIPQPKMGYIWAHAMAGSFETPSPHPELCNHRKEGGTAGPLCLWVLCPHTQPTVYQKCLEKNPIYTEPARAFFLPKQYNYFSLIGFNF
jgi:hypothetical protein